MHSPFAISPSTILVDARALQDRDYRYRGVGQHSTVILRALRFCVWGDRRPRMVALIDPSLEHLADEHALLFDEISATGYPAVTGSLFLSLSSMTHDPVWASKYLLDPNIFRVSLFYDLIQLQFPNRYLPNLEGQLSFLTNLLWLKKYDCFSAISKFCVGELTNIVNIPADRIFVSYVAVRQGLEPAPSSTVRPFEERKHVLFAGGGDPRKNPDCAVIAHARSRRLREAKIDLVLFGNYNPETRLKLRTLHASNGGDPHSISFLNHLTDEDLQQFYANAVLTVVASKAEGFSIPIVESNAAGTPVLASDVGAHPELFPNPAHRFNPDDPDGLRKKLDELCTDAHSWSVIKDAQDGLWRRFTVEAVGEAFLRGLAGAYRGRIAAPSVHRGTARPSLSLLSPLPPAASGVADYSAATFKALARKADLHVYTSVPGVAPCSWFASLNSITQARFSARQRDATVAVIGNSHFHTSEFEYLLENGCAAIAHDARMINYYVQLRGMESAIKIATQECGHAVEESTVRDWLHNQDRLPILFMSEIARCAKPLMVHSPMTANIIEEHYRERPVLLPFAQYNSLDLTAATPSRRREIRQKLGWSDDEVVLCTFGYVSDDKAPEELIWATKILNDWKIPATLKFCGQPHYDTGVRAVQLVEELGITEKVSFERKFVPQDLYREYIFAADIGVQLRTYFMGGLSGALNDCIAAALPSIANDHLAEAMIAPSFVRRIPDKLSPILIAEAVLDILDSRQNQERPIDEATFCARERSPDVYAEKLLAALGFA
ncbi:glycosyltransferase [Methylobacterium sp. CB376]|uniref:glycosyltransferase n=1 Tax=unclassified Methylobacterium TaxID=2615210 RepID=UPI00030576AD|nr:MULTISPECIES: glycosyltransferase [Methylobacterium]WFT80517.1 glycosyltransferase [Methylobacterium nodulans]